ncbi:cation channel sperm-associated protein 1 [Alligator mississippiensis]|uniref:Cation channel sperm-associated protein 1 n=1 Tax=Alligator mississippiensis TaxID=8496 RepID=A0A151NU46_ALLMI|nr:cation channel sperm-associated protein 1 [Alligator mississippiensis]
MLFRLGVVVVVCIHTLMLVAQTFAAVQIRGEWFFSVLDAVFLCVYVVEALVKLVAFGLDYFRDPWNDIDFLVMGLMLLDFTLPLVVLPGNAWFEDVMFLLRLLRIFKGVRAFRLVHLLLSLRGLESLQELAGTFALSGRSIGAILLLMFTCLFIFSVLLRDLFARSDPERFGHLLDTVFTLFQLLTLDDWSFIYRDSAQQGASYIIIFLMAYILIEYFTFLNPLLGLCQRSHGCRGPTVLDPGLAEDDKRLAQLVERLEGSERQKQLLLGHLRRLAQVERLQQELRSRAATSDHIVDTFFETAEQDFLRH